MVILVILVRDGLWFFLWLKTRIIITI
jgi:hypothetical protein